MKNQISKTKKEILIASAPMFMEYGYDKTTYQMIADKLDISKSVITYHYKSKPLLVSSFFEDYIYLLLDFMEDYLASNTNSYVRHCIIHICLYREVISNDSIKELFFHDEIFSLWFHGKISVIEGYFRDITNDFNKDYSEEEIHVAAVMNQGAKLSLYDEYLQNPSPISVDKYCYYYVYLLGLLSRLDESTIEKNIERAYAFINSHDIPHIELFK